MITLPFQQQFTWRKLGYDFYTNSLEYRSVLELNPQWVVTELPPIGAQIFLPEPDSTAGSLTQSTFISGVAQGESEDAIFPFDTETEYVNALNKYSYRAIYYRNRINGYSMDDEAAFTGVQ